MFIFYAFMEGERATPNSKSKGRQRSTQTAKGEGTGLKLALRKMASVAKKKRNSVVPTDLPQGTEYFNSS